MSPVYASQITHHVKSFCLQEVTVLKEQGGKSHVLNTIWCQECQILVWDMNVYTILCLLNANVISISGWEGLGSFMEGAGLFSYERWFQGWWEILVAKYLPYTGNKVFGIFLFYLLSFFIFFPPRNRENM